MLPYKNQAWVGLALCHLLLVVLGASNVDLSRLGFLGRILQYYGELSGAGSGYGFFAPGISGQLRVRFDLYDSQGRQSAFTLASAIPSSAVSNSASSAISSVERPTSHEARLRIGNIVDRFPIEDSDQDIYDNSDEMEAKLKRSLAASLAVSMFNHHPDVKELVVYLEEFSPVSMEEYRSGLISQWRVLYQAKFKGL